MAEVLWYYAKNDRQLGPVTPADLKQLASNGGLFPEDLIWREGMEGWAPAARVKGLFPEPREREPDPLLPPVNNGPTETMPPTVVAAIVNAAPAIVPEAPPPAAPNIPADVSATPPIAATPENRLATRATPDSGILEKPSGLATADYLWLAQVILWGICIAIVLFGGLLFMRAFIKATSPAEETAAGAVFATFFIGAYVIARAGERVAALVQTFFDRRRK